MYLVHEEDVYVGSFEHLHIVRNARRPIESYEDVLVLVDDNARSGSRNHRRAPVGVELSPICLPKSRVLCCDERGPLLRPRGGREGSADDPPKGQQMRKQMEPR
jgi:hypothetical protein